jgi:hypothetical protein
MNIFVLHENPIIAAEMHCDKHVPKMVVEAAQMMASALRRWGATDEDMPLTKAGKPYKGGYAHHPCTVWAGDSWANLDWLASHAIALCQEYEFRFGKEHACWRPIIHMNSLVLTPRFFDDADMKLTPFAQAMPDEYRDDDAVKAYRALLPFQAVRQVGEGHTCSRLVARRGGDGVSKETVPCPVCGW